MRLAAALFLAVAFIPTGNAGVVTHHQWASVRLGAGAQKAAFTLHEPRGEIRVYRLTAPRGTDVRAFARVKGITVWLKIGTRGGGCHTAGTRIDCSVGEEGCPMPEADWQFRVAKVSGPAGEVRLWFRVSERRFP